MTTRLQQKFNPSASSLKLVSNCEQAAMYRYFYEYPHDDDYLSPDYFAFGRAFHAVAERMNHKWDDDVDSIILGAAADHWDATIIGRARLRVMYKSYVDSLPEIERVLACELRIETDEWLMIMDAIVETSDGWKIRDLKTVSDIVTSPRPKMLYDEQVALYSSQHHLVAEKLDLDPQKFLGFEYSQVKKPAERMKKTESVDEYCEILTSGTKHTLVLWRDIQNTGIINEVFKKKLRLKALMDNPKGALKNYSQCSNMFGTCPYFKRCHGGISAKEF